MMKRLLFCLILILGVNAATAESIITVNINKSGDAVWTMEKLIPLTKSGLNEWEIAIKTGQNLSSYRTITDYEDIITLLRNSTMNFTNRSMVVEPFNITYDTRKTLSDGLGIVRYTFIWKNFSYSDSENIYVGDAFPGGVLLLSPDNQLIIKIPDGYNVTSSTPVFDKRNGNQLIWDGTLYNNFSNGEPFLILSRVNATNVTTVMNAKNTNMMWIISAIVISVVVIVVLVAFIRFWKKKRRENVSTAKIAFYEDMVTQVPKEMLNEISEIPEVWTKIVQSVQREFGQESIEELEKAAREQRLKNMGLDPNIPLSELAKEDMEDEEMIRQFILRSGGQAYQSDIVEHSGLSKSKISMVLSKMKDDGMIIKIRKGKENLIRLVNISATNKGA